MAFSLLELAEQLQAELRHISVDDARSRIVTGLSSPTDANVSQLVFLIQSKYLDATRNTQALAIVTSEEFSKDLSKPLLIVSDPYQAFAILSCQFEYQTPTAQEAIHPTAVISESAVISPSALIEAGVVIGANTVINDNVRVGANTIIADAAIIGEGSFLEPQVTIGHHVIIGKNCRIHSGARIGGEGFGFAPSKDGWKRIAQLGSVQIGDFCRIGANTTIDRGALDNTIIGNNVIIDNQVQIAHNVQIGDRTAIAACVGIAGSTVIGSSCIIGGGTGIAGHITIVDHVHLTGMSMVTRSITEPGSYSSGTGLFKTNQWRKVVVSLRHLPNQLKKLSAIVKHISFPDDYSH